MTITEQPLNKMARERITETLQPSRTITRAFEAAKHFAGNIKGFSRVDISFDESGASITSINLMDGVAVSCPPIDVNSNISGSFLTDIQFLYRLLKTVSKRDLQFSFFSRDLFADFPFLTIKGKNTFSYVSFKKEDRVIFKYETDEHPNFEVLAGDFTSALETKKVYHFVKTCNPFEVSNYRLI